LFRDGREVDIDGLGEVEHLGVIIVVGWEVILVRIEDGWSRWWTILHEIIEIIAKASEIAIAAGGANIIGGWGRQATVDDAWGRGTLVTVLAIVLGTNVGPTMGLFHVLFAIRLTLGCVLAILKPALEEWWGSGVLVVVVSVHLFLGGPAMLVVFAGLDRALPWARVRLLVLG
jgi:hypothetical protein